MRHLEAVVPLVALFLVLEAAPAAAQVDAIQISEIMHHPPTPGEDLEFLELTNVGTSWVDLSGWQFTEGIAFTIPDGVFLGPGRFVAIARKAAELRAAGGENVLGDFVGALDNAGEPIALVDRSGLRVFRFRFDDDGDWPAGADGCGSSLERATYDHDPDWGASFAASRVLGGTPGRPNSIDDPASDDPLTPCRINELVVAAGAATVELYNPDAAAAPLTGYSMVPDARLDLATDLAGVSAPGRGYATASVNLTGITGNVVRLFLIEKDSLRLADVFEVGPVGGSGAYARYPDGHGRAWKVPGGTLGQPNAAPQNSSVLISEIFYHPPSEDFREEWIELYNNSDQPIDMTGWSIGPAVDFTFPEGTILGARATLIVAADPLGFKGRYGRDAVGPYAGALRDSRELVALADPDNQIMDEVAYADDGPWPPEADGLGRSLVRRNAALPGRAPGSWAASAADGGEPGAVSFAADSATDPVIHAVTNTPGVPRPGETIAVSGLVAGAQAIASVTLSWKEDGEATYRQVAATLGDTEPLAGLRFAATIPPRAGDVVVQFYVSALQSGGRVARFPAAGDALFAVDAQGDAADTVTFRIVMEDANWQILWDRPYTSDDRLPCTLVYRGVPYYGAEMRFRGQSARHYDPRSFRIDLGDHHAFPIMTTIALNAQRPEDQRLGLDLLKRSGVPASLSRFVEIVATAMPDRVYRHHRSYLQVEVIDDEFLKRAFSHEEETGNLYRGEGSATLSYRGEDPASYAPYYVKRTNVLENDYTDVIALCRTLSDQAEFEAHVAEIVDVPEWSQWYGIMAILNNEENGLANDRGDDYYIYDNPVTGRFLILPWDLDTLLNTPTERLFRPTLPAVQRLLTWPPAARRYTEAIVTELATHARPDILADRIEPGLAFGSVQEIAKLTTNAPARADFLAKSMPSEIRAGVVGGLSLISWNDTWRYFKGRADPSPGLEWTRATFDDNAWPSDEGGFGFGDDDDRTVLADMLGSYTTVYIRKKFTVLDPSRVTDLSLEVLIDDGFVAYLNGQEIARFNAGTAGTALHHDAVADQGLEPSVRSSALSNPAGLLVAGTNVLAILGLNRSSGSTDFSLDAHLASSAMAGSYGWGDVIATEASMVTIEGTSIPDKTTQVLVDGNPVDYDVTSFAWRTTFSPQAGRNAFTVELRDETGAARAAKEIVLWRKPVVRIPALVETNQSWPAEGGPYLIEGTTQIASGAAVTLEPGATVFAMAGSRLVVRGGLQALGRADEPLHVMAGQKDAPWGGIRIESEGSGTLRGAILDDGGSGAPLFEVAGGTLELRGCRANRIAHWVVRAVGGTVTIVDLSVSGAAGGIAAESADVDLTASRFTDLGQDYAVSSIGGSLDLLNCAFARGARGVYLGGSAQAIGLRCSDFTTEGVRIGQTGVRGSHVLVEGGGTGIRVEASCTASFDHVTVVNSETAIALDSSAAFTLRDSILWQNGFMLAGQAGAALTAEYGDLESPMAGPGNISVDPAFGGGVELPYRIRGGSPCAGTASDGSDRGALPADAAIPTIASVSPAAGSPAGGTLVTVAGTGFMPETVVLIDSVPLLDLQFVDATRIRGLTPPRATPGTVTVQVVTPAGWSPAPASFTYGDVVLRGDPNGSGAIDISDAAFILLYLYKRGIAPACLDSADVNHDDKLNIADAISLLNFLFAKGTPPTPAQANC